MVFEPERQIGLFDLALEGPLVREKQVLGELLRDRRSALHDAGGLGIDRDGPERADEVDAEMLVEPAVLRRQDGLDQIGGHLVDRHAVVVQNATPTDFRAAAIEEGHGEILLLQPVLGRILDRRDCQGERHDGAAEPKRQALAGDLRQATPPARDAEPIHEGRVVVVTVAQAAAALEQRRVQPRVQGQQDAANATHHPVPSNASRHALLLPHCSCPWHCRCKPTDAAVRTLFRFRICPAIIIWRALWRSAA